MYLFAHEFFLTFLNKYLKVISKFTKAQDISRFEISFRLASHNQSTGFSFVVSNVRKWLQKCIICLRTRIHKIDFKHARKALLNILHRSLFIIRDIAMNIRIKASADCLS